MSHLTRFDLCQLAAKIVADEYGTPDFTVSTNAGNEYDKARYIYAWFCFNELNAPQRLIRHTMLCYKYKKTIYQVLRRMYLRRRDNELKYDLLHIKSRFQKELEKYEVKQIKPVKEGKQLKLDYVL